MNVNFTETFALKYILTEDEKNGLLEEYSNNFTQAHKLMAWIEDPNVPVQERAQYFTSMYLIFESMSNMLKLLLAAGINELEIIKALNDLPF
jgi:hypothetical protein